MLTVAVLPNNTSAVWFWTCELCGFVQLFEETQTGVGVYWSWSDSGVSHSDVIGPYVWMRHRGIWLNSSIWRPWSETGQCWHFFCLDRVKLSLFVHRTSRLPAGRAGWATAKRYEHEMVGKPYGTHTHTHTQLSWLVEYELHISVFVCTELRGRYH